MITTFGIVCLALVILVAKVSENIQWELPTWLQFVLVGAFFISIACFVCVACLLALRYMP